MKLHKKTRAGYVFSKKVLTPFAAVLLGLSCVAGTAAICLWRPVAAPTDEQRYRAAVLDSVTIEEDEIFPLVTITPESDMVTWRDGKVLLMTVNCYPERYVMGETLTLPGEVWTVTDQELSTWYSQNKKGVTDWTLRFKQLIGLPPNEECTHVTAMWVSPEDVHRPAYNTDITTATMHTALPEGVSEEYRKWFDGNLIWSYFDSAYPWTRLGYTYDWAAGRGEYGLTEFLVQSDAQVTVEFTDTIDEFIGRLEQADGHEWR